MEKSLWEAADRYRANCGLKAQEYSGRRDARGSKKIIRRQLIEAYFGTDAGGAPTYRDIARLCKAATLEGSEAPPLRLGC
jgi:hypothetical protein